MHGSILALNFSSLLVIDLLDQSPYILIAKVSKRDTILSSIAQVPIYHLLVKGTLTLDHLFKRGVGTPLERATILSFYLVPPHPNPLPKEVVL